MELHQLEQTKMQIMSELANTNLKISEAKNVIFKLQEEETEYLIEREKKALGKIQNVLQESRNLIEETHQNYAQVEEFCQTLVGFSDFLNESHDKMSLMLETFKKKNELWDENVKIQYEEIARQRKIVEQDTKAIESREQRIEEARLNLVKEREQIESRQQALLISYKIEKELFDKLITIKK